MMGERGEDGVARLARDEPVGDAEKTPAPERTPGRRAGGPKGGRARAEKLTPEERSAIAHP